VEIKLGFKALCRYLLKPVFNFSTCSDCTKCQRINFNSFSENMIKASSAKLKMNQTVTKISKNRQNGKWTVTTTDSSNKYDIVILATPPHHSNISLISKISQYLLGILNHYFQMFEMKSPKSTMFSSMSLYLQQTPLI
jgi:hypothetical protein